MRLKNISPLWTRGSRLRNIHQWAARDRLLTGPMTSSPGHARGRCPVRPVAASLAAGLALLVSCLAAGGAAAAAGGTFATRLHDARGLAMGGATVTLVKGDAAVHWNPSRLPYGLGRSVTVAHGDLIEDFPSGLTTISVGVPWGGDPTDEYGIGHSARWAVGGYVSHLGLDDVGGSARWSESAVSGAFSRTLGEYASAGLSVRYLNVGSDIDEGSANGAAADLAVTVQTTDATCAAVVVRNAAGSLHWKSGWTETLEASADLAFSYTHAKYGAAEITVNVGGAGIATAAIGAEAVLGRGGLSLWGGLKRINDAQVRYIPSLGVGVPVGAVDVGYGAAFDEDATFGTVQRFSVSARF